MDNKMSGIDAIRGKRVESFDLPYVIAGPCSAEQEGQVLHTADELYKRGCKAFRAGVWKPRTKPGGFEGKGVEALEWMSEVKKRHPEMLIATEVALPEHIDACLKYDVDILWIGARTAANPFAVQAIADRLKHALERKEFIVLVKNPVNPDLDLWIGAIERLRLAGVKKIAAVHRGFSVYDSKVFRNVPMWQIPIDLKKKIDGIKVLCDPSHIGGKRELVAPLMQQAHSLGFDGFMVECHDNPDEAWTDAKQQILPEVLEYILDSFKPVGKEEKSTGTLSTYREQIDLIDDEIIIDLKKRMDFCKKIALTKLENAMPVFQEHRYQEVMRKFVNKANSLGLNEDLARQIFNSIHEESVRLQTETIDNYGK